VLTPFSFLKTKKQKQNSVYLGYHTLHQVIAGSLVGTCFGLCWYAIVKLLYSSGIIDTIVNLSIAKMIYLKDMRMIDNVAKWEYQQWEKARNQTNSNNKKAI
jgi:dolichyldiphosphatase